MGDAKRIAEAEEKRRGKKISFLREHVPEFLIAQTFGSGQLPQNYSEALDFVSVLFDCIENRAKAIATGEEDE